ncbi:MAG: helix-turn-helix transcriptional regulator [Deltaproteobacteria bacterium]|nr:helix-turn-helix transcriptional regulator [Deltaproteobacteria bacterium]
MSDISKKIKILRSATKRTQKSFAEMLGFSKGYLADIETDRIKPSRKFLEAIQLKCGVSIDWLLQEGIKGPLFKGRTKTWEDILKTKPLRQDPLYHGLNITMNSYNKALQDMFNVLSEYKYSMSETDEIDVELLKSKGQMMDLLDILQTLVSSLFNWTPEEGNK